MNLHSKYSIKKLTIRFKILQKTRKSNPWNIDIKLDRCIKLHSQIPKNTAEFFRFDLKEKKSETLCIFMHLIFPGTLRILCRHTVDIREFIVMIFFICCWYDVMNFSFRNSRNFFLAENWIYFGKKYICAICYQNKKKRIG